MLTDVFVFGITISIITPTLQHIIFWWMQLLSHNKPIEQFPANYIESLILLMCDYAFTEAGICSKDVGRLLIIQ